MKLAALIDAITLPGLAWGAADINASGGLFASEDAAMRRAVPARRAEFLAGRLAARQALETLGQTPVPIPMQKDRAPRWPEGVIGSISHSNGLAVAVAARTGAFGGLGVDLEPSEALAAPDFEEIADETEREYQRVAPNWGRCLFSAKEAAFKAQYPQTGTVFGFSGVRVAPDLTAAWMKKTPETDGLPASWFALRMPLRQSQDSAWILTLCTLPCQTGQNCG